jgi:hypothetical protein
VRQVTCATWWSVSSHAYTRLLRTDTLRTVAASTGGERGCAASMGALCKSYDATTRRYTQHTRARATTASSSTPTYAYVGLARGIVPLLLDVSEVGEAACVRASVDCVAGDTVGVALVCMRVITSDDVIPSAFTTCEREMVLPATNVVATAGAKLPLRSEIALVRSDTTAACCLAWPGAAVAPVLVPARTTVRHIPTSTTQCHARTQVSPAIASRCLALRRAMRAASAWVRVSEIAVHIIHTHTTRTARHHAPESARDTTSTRAQACRCPSETPALPCWLHTRVRHRLPTIQGGNLSTCRTRTRRTCGSGGVC